MKKLLFLTLDLIAFIIAVFLGTQYFNWFIQPVFPNTPMIDMKQGIGVFLFIGLFRVINTTAKDIQEAYEDKLSAKEKISMRINKILAYCICYLIGWIIHNYL